jgi:anti-sigma regulatory factor (Ser/Thr protein kinase)
MSTGEGEKSIVMAVEADIAAVPSLRKDLAAVASSWGFRDVESVEVVLAELVTNAIIHTKSAPIVRLSRTGAQQIRVEVTDERPDLPVYVAPYDNHTRGLGLYIVDSLTDDWGVDPGARSKVVWAEVGDGVS